MEYRQQAATRSLAAHLGRLRTSRCALHHDGPRSRLRHARPALRLPRRQEPRNRADRPTCWAPGVSEYVSDYLATVSTAMQPSLMLTSRWTFWSLTWRAPTPSIHPQRRAGSRHRAGHAGHLWRSHLESQLKAAYLVNFLKYVEWPGARGTVNLPVRPRRPRPLPGRLRRPPDRQARLRIPEGEQPGTTGRLP